MRRFAASTRAGGVGTMATILAVARASWRTAGVSAGRYGGWGVGGGRWRVRRSKSESEEVPGPAKALRWLAWASLHACPPRCVVTLRVMRLGRG